MIFEYFLEWAETAPVGKRVEAVNALVRSYLHSGLSPEERDDAEAALTTLLDDPAPAVRLEMAHAFGSWKNAPRHLMQILAGDATEIAITVLSQSPVFVDAELVEWVRRGDAEHQIAIACRPWLTQKVVSAICQHGCEEACLGLLMNPVARFARRDFASLAERHGTRADIRLILQDRKDLPAEVRLKLVGKLGEALKGFVTEKGWLGEKRSAAVFSDADDKAAILYSATVGAGDLDAIVSDLLETRRLTPAFLLRAVCMGNISIVACSLAHLSGIDAGRIETMLVRDRQSAFRSVYDRAGLPSEAFAVFNSAVGSWRNLLFSGTVTDPARLPFLVTREILQNYVRNESEIVDELLVLLRKLAAETARDSALAKSAEMSTRLEEVKLYLEQMKTPVAEPSEVETDPEIDPEMLEAFARNLADELEADAEDRAETGMIEMPEVVDIYEQTFGPTPADNDNQDCGSPVVTIPVAEVAEDEPLRKSA